MMWIVMMINLICPMKAFVFLTYDDDSEVMFEYSCDEDRVHALGTLYMVCRGTLMASLAKRITAYDEDGFDLCSYVK